jgi:hypothetical protein
VATGAVFVLMLVGLTVLETPILSRTIASVASFSPASTVSMPWDGRSQLGGFD